MKEGGREGSSRGGRGFFGRINERGGLTEQSVILLYVLLRRQSGGSETCIVTATLLTLLLYRINAKGKLNFLIVSF